MKIENIKKEFPIFDEKIKNIIDKITDYMENYENYNNIDLVGFNDDNQIKPLQLSLFINKETMEFYLTENQKFVNVKTCMVITLYAGIAQGALRLQMSFKVTLHSLVMASRA